MLSINFEENECVEKGMSQIFLTELTVIMVELESNHHNFILF